MPLHYGSQIAEHHAVRNTVGRFDVSHMGVINLPESEGARLLSIALASDIRRLDSGQAFYTVILNEQAGIIDDLIVYRLNSGYRLVVNAARKHIVRQTLMELAANHHVQSSDAIELSMDSCILALQGPQAIDVASQIFKTDLSELKRFQHIDRDGVTVARTGYTGEDGIEVIASNIRAIEIWTQLDDFDVTCCGLGSRDTLRLEAGLNLYGNDMSEDTHPDASNLKWVVHLNAGRDVKFQGQDALVQQRRKPLLEKLTGVVLRGRGVIRTGAQIYTNAGKGVVTSGSFSPTLGYGIGLVRVPVSADGDCEVEVHRKTLNGRLVRPPFVRNGKRVHS